MPGQDALPALSPELDEASSSAHGDQSGFQSVLAHRLAVTLVTPKNPRVRGIPQETDETVAFPDEITSRLESSRGVVESDLIEFTHAIRVNYIVAESNEWEIDALDSPQQVRINCARQNDSVD